MDKYQAEKIINRYGAAIEADENVFKKRSTLPCSRARIRYAFYFYIPAIIQEFGHLPKGMGESLAGSYGLLDAFIADDDAYRLNKIGELIRNKQLSAVHPEDKQKIDEFFTRQQTAWFNFAYRDEINEYIAECYKEMGVHM